jgi:hypothetical protein
MSSLSLFLVGGCHRGEQSGLCRCCLDGTVHRVGQNRLHTLDTTMIMELSPLKINRTCVLVVQANPYHKLSGSLHS